jgi:hypothetical protein
MECTPGHSHCPLFLFSLSPSLHCPLFPDALSTATSPDSSAWWHQAPLPQHIRSPCRPTDCTGARLLPGTHTLICQPGDWLHIGTVGALAAVMLMTPCGRRAHVNGGAHYVQCPSLVQCLTAHLMKAAPAFRCAPQGLLSLLLLPWLHVLHVLRPRSHPAPPTWPLHQILPRRRAAHALQAINVETGQGTNASTW